MVILIVLVILFVGLRFGNRRVKKVSPNVSNVRLPNLKVVTYNTHLLPPVARLFAGKRSDSEYRCKTIAGHLSQFDLCGLSEVFDEKLAAKMIDELNSDAADVFSFTRSPSPTGVFQFSSGGLLLFSRFPIMQQNSLTFSQGSRFLTTRFQAADGLAAKGVLHARLQFDHSQEIDCFLIHLESFSKPIRTKQLKETASFVKSHARSGVPYLLMGDLNIVGPLDSDASTYSEYAEMMKRLTINGFELIDVALHPSDGIVKGTSNALTDDGGDRIDYLLLGMPTTNTTRYSASSNTIRFLDETVKEGSLSDHAAVVARIEIRNPSQVD